MSDRLEDLEAQHGDYVRVLSNHAAIIAGMQQTTAALQQTTAVLQQTLATFIAENAAFRQEVNRRFDQIEDLIRSKSNGHAKEGT
jgi:hypothetical protein